VHQSPAYPAGHRQSLDCADCHTGNNELNTWRFPAYQPDCAGCHANDYESDEHKKTDQGNLLYNVGELRDCTGSCHVYSDPSLTTISDFKTGQHRVSDPAFDD
jgi:hypothetical protein